MDTREDQNQIVEVCLRYAGAIDTMVMDEMAGVMGALEEDVNGMRSRMNAMDVDREAIAQTITDTAGLCQSLWAELQDTWIEIERLRELMNRLRHQGEVQADLIEKIQALMVTTQLKSHLVSNSVLGLCRQLRQVGVNIPANSGWEGSGMEDVPAPSEAPSVPSSSWGSGSTQEDPLEIVLDSEYEDAVVIPPPPRWSWWDYLIRLVEILDGQDTGIVAFLADEDMVRRHCNEEFAAGQLQAEAMADRDPVPEFKDCLALYDDLFPETL
jgi:hypothetical protein